MPYGFTSRAKAAASTSRREWSRVLPSAFGFWPAILNLDRSRDQDLRPGLRSFPANEYVIIYRIEDDDVVLILHVVHGSRDIVGLFGD